MESRTNLSRTGQIPSTATIENRYHRSSRTQSKLQNRKTSSSPFPEIAISHIFPQPTIPVDISITQFPAFDFILHRSLHKLHRSLQQISVDLQLFLI
jgi:hypothetical protein